MALRELLKVDTSNDNQALQNNYFKTEMEVKSETEENKEEADSVRKQDIEDKSHENDINRGEKRKIEEETEVDVKKKKEEIENDK